MSRAITRSRNVGCIKGLKVSSNSIPITDVQFVDDLLLPGEANIRNGRNLLKILQIFKRHQARRSAKKNPRISHKCEFKTLKNWRGPRITNPRNSY